MNKLAGFLAGVLRDLTRDHAEVAKENAFLRAQVQIYKSQIKRPKLDAYDRALLVFLSKLVPRWRELLDVVTPDTLVRWTRDGFRDFWARISGSGKKAPRRKLSAETLEAIQQLVLETTWGSKRIVGELLSKLNIKVHKKTVQKALKRERPRRPNGQSWSTFIRNHMDVTWACDFFTVPTLWFGQIYVFFFMKLGTREILHWNVTYNPTRAWTVQQLKNVLAWSEKDAPRFLLRDQDGKFADIFDEIAKGAGTEVIVTGHPTENAFAERLVGSVRREVLAHFSVLGEGHLRWILGEYFGHFNRQRPHQGIAQAIPSELESLVERARRGRIVRDEILNGLIGEYRRAA